MKYVFEKLAFPVSRFYEYFNIEVSGEITKIVYEPSNRVLTFHVKKAFGDFNRLKEKLKVFFGVNVEIEYEVTELEREEILGILNGTAPYVKDVEIFENEILIRTFGEFAKKKIEKEINHIEKVTGKTVKVEIVEETFKIEPPKIENNLKKFDEDKKYYFPSNIPLNAKRVFLRGKVFKLEQQYGVFSVYITDRKESILGKIFDNANEFSTLIKEGNWYYFKGSMGVDKRGGYYFAINDVFKDPSPIERKDTYEEKRVELHIHSKMSDLDAIVDIKEVVRKVKEWGWSAVAITDHGNVQSIPYLFEEAEKNGIKPIFGTEMYVLNEMGDIVKNLVEDKMLDDVTYTVFDLETTGTNAKFDEIIEIGAVKYRDGKVINTFSSFVKPTKSISEFTQKLTGITDEMVKDAKSIEEVFPEFLKFIDGTVLVAHNADFDYGFIREVNRRLYNKELDFAYLDTLKLSKVLLRGKVKSFGLGKLVEYFKLGPFKHHRAFEDASVTADLFGKLLELLLKRGIKTLGQVNNLKNTSSISTIRTKKQFNHITILVRDKVGLKNLYKLVSDAHVKYFKYVPFVPKKELIKYREGLLLGTGCESGEIFQALTGSSTDEEILEMLKDYDYVEIFPLDTIVSVEREVAKQVYKRLYELAKRLDLPVVMVSNAHFLEPEDIKARHVLLSPIEKSNPHDDDLRDKDAKLYLRTTDEMMKEAFEIFEDEKIAYEIVVENTNKIANNMIEDVKPIKRKLHPPIIEGADEKVRSLSIKRAKELYGDPLPDVIEKRLEKELESIIGHGYAVLYEIAHLIVKKANEDGYVVGSRGSVGSSFVAYLMGITEVNPLPPHYLCPKCKYLEFSKDMGSGYDLPNKLCPKCGTKLEKTGQDIPFEVFMGFKGDKVPDIDLNFSGEYQERAHSYIVELFGKDNVLRAGTISTIAEKSAIGYVKSYMEVKGETLHQAEQIRLAEMVAGVKRTTGQHPGGLMIVPKDMTVYDFTPIQYPANKKDSEMCTTHFAYESIHDDLVKLDALGHDDPTMLKLLYEYTGVDPTKVPMDDKKTLEIFSSLKPLKVKAEELGIDVGTIGIPEFGTNFVQEMLKETRPKTFAELVRISGLSHGTDVWLNNAQDIIKSGNATLSEVISCRDDIMIYLINAGVEESRAFKIMENVRKGKGISEDDEKLMREKNVPEWFIQSCKKIKYLFPKAHAVAYVSMAFRIAYFKVHYPLAYYAAYFSIKGDEFSIETILRGIKSIKKKLAELNAQMKKDVKEKNEEKVLEAALEMYLRGYSFLPPDILKSDYRRFIIEGNELRIPLNKIPGVGDNVALSIIQARMEKPFTSIDDLKKRTKLSKAHINTMRKLRILEDLPETDQSTLFDF
ncbi:DNA polymerase III PolC [Thermosipho melanesiensis]|uniref:DNA polymerase III PolC-type n=2 Tax=Thermosipho melanesiensis TaxID=46541 RepID=A6LLU9_THEM4|nr:PolC-type DNA polymerase III [Thermosipho melanesiensis]ABR30900.1 DNA polymerase III, alpha subunit [Thermosipho melanesiensis BI429]APT74019.1 DNA polymerase III PolC [Thermosipho melanesiensis]OOC35947.1 DNA polymerase III PolC [Thermosipho melanesiensis]OOC38449.1 DNA polymerase III PolC [Thermosipho melanesiensis]OOC38910.1 DNA polymerase III PolC [Thermosipho melanesiensis]